MLAHLGEVDAAKRVEAAVAATFESGECMIVSRLVPMLATKWRVRADVETCPV